MAMLNIIIRKKLNENKTTTGKMGFASMLADE